MSGDGHVSLSGRTLTTVRQLAETNTDHVVLDKDTYLIDENYRIISIPSGTVAILEDDSEKTAAVTNFSPTEHTQSSTTAVMSSAASMETGAVNMPADSTSMENMPLAAAVTHSSASTISASCEVVEATSSDPNPSVSLSDMYVQEEEEVMEETKDQEAVVSASGPVEPLTQSQPKEVGRKRGRKKKTSNMPDEGQGDGNDQEVKRKKRSIPTAEAEKPSPAPEPSPGSKSNSVSPVVSTVSASGRPQRSTPRRSVFELLHEGRSKPQPSKKQKVSKTGTTGEEDHKEAVDEKVSGEPGSTQSKGHRQQPSVQALSQTSVSSEGCDGSSNCATLNDVSHVSAHEPKSSSRLSSGCAAATSDSNLVQSTSDEVANVVRETKTDVSKPEIKSIKSGDEVENSSAKKAKQLKKAMLSKQGISRPSGVVIPPKGSYKKKMAGKHNLGSRLTKMKGLKKPSIAATESEMVSDDIKMPGKPYHYFTSDDSKGLASDSDGESSALLADDLSSEDVVWMRQRISELEQEVSHLQDNSGDKRPSRCWQDVLSEFSDLPPVEVDEKSMLDRYEKKLRVLDRELDDRASFLRVREGCIARRERRIQEKESTLKKRERELEHQRRLQGRVKLPSESAADSSALSPGSADSSAASNRKQALEKEVRLELRKQELDRQKHALDGERKKLAAKKRELDNREQAMVDADLLTMASSFNSSRPVESRGVEANHPNGGTTTVEFSDDEDDSFGGNSFSTFGATSMSLPFSLDRTKHQSDEDHRETAEVCSVEDIAARSHLLDAANEDLKKVLQDVAPSVDDASATELTTFPQLTS